jgi:hypothetical protein
MSYSKADADVISGKLTPMSYCTIGPLSGPVPSHPEARHRRRGPPETLRNWTFTRPHPPTGETWPRHALTPAAPSGCRPSGQVSAARRDRGGRIATTVARALPTMASHPRTVRSAPPGPSPSAAGRGECREGRADRPRRAEPNSIRFYPGRAKRVGMAGSGISEAAPTRRPGSSGLPPSRSGKGGRIRGPSANDARNVATPRRMSSRHAEGAAFTPQPVPQNHPVARPNDRTNYPVGRTNDPR